MTYFTLGSTQDITTCDCCGKANLKKTIVAVQKDEAGNLDYSTLSHFGSTCVTKLARVKKLTDHSVTIENFTLPSGRVISATFVGKSLLWTNAAFSGLRKAATEFGTTEQQAKVESAIGL